VDAVPVVRCQECKFSQPWYADKSRCFLWHESGIDVFNDGYCSYGKRKEDET
jgi:Zn ribbon nucleic-acid-binding protein